MSSTELIRIRKSWTKVKRVETSWEELRRGGQRWESLRRVGKKWEVARRVEKRWKDLKRAAKIAENSWEKLWKELKRAETCEKGCEEPRSRCHGWQDWNEKRTYSQNRVEKMWGFPPASMGKTCLSSYSETFLATGNFRASSTCISCMRVCI